MWVEYFYNHGVFAASWWFCSSGVIHVVGVYIFDFVSVFFKVVLVFLVYLTEGDKFVWVGLVYE